MSLHSLPTDAILRASVTGAPSQKLTLVHRDEGFSLIPPDPQDEISSAGQVVTQTLGPFIDAGGRHVAIDVLASTSFIPVQRTSQAFPFLYVSSAHSLPFTGIPNLVQYGLGAGTVWISAPLLSNDAPASTLVGVQISSGRLRWNGSPIFFPGPAPTSITVPATTTVSLSLVLDPQPSQPGVSPPVTEFSVQTPQNATLEFTPTAASLAAADDAKLTVLGTVLTLSRIAAPATYDYTFNRLRLAFNADKSQVAVVQSSAQLVNVTGSANINSASWALPLISAPSSPTDNMLPSASGVGGLSLDVQSGLTILPSINNNTSINCGPCTFLAEKSTFAVAGRDAVGGRATLVIPLWSSSQVIFRPEGPFTFRYINQFDGHESWATILSCITKLDQPRTINNERLTVVSLNAALIFLRNGAATSCVINALRNPKDIQSRSFAMKNLLLKTRIGRFTVRGSYTASGVTDGVLTLQLIVLTALPFLPDPYTSNFAPSTGNLGLATLNTVITWQASKFSSIDMTFEPRLNTNRLSGSVSPAPVSTLGVFRPSNIPTLLDLSTNVSQFGVSFFLNVTKQPPLVKDMFLQVKASSLAVMALPAVQWEPVVTNPNPDAFQTPLTFQNSGPATLLISNSVTLTPIAPRQAIDNLLSDYHANSPSAITARFTLPFGLVAEATLTQSLTFLVITPLLNNIQLTFLDSKLQAGDQLSIGASQFVIFDPTAPQFVPLSIPGTIVLPKNASYNGTSTSDTVLGVLQDTFTTEFTQNPRIPVTRVDLSGFGESMFSDWRDPTSLPPTISKVALDVLVGRTAKEVVQAFSILYPYGVAVVRTITIERENSATIVRHDSGWQAVSDGRYQFPVPAGTTPLVTHPGLVKGVVDVINIRDLTPEQMYKIPVGADTIELMPVKFDCFADIENVILGGTSKGVLALDQLGYVQITKLPGGSSLTSSQYATLLQDNGPLGGLVDCVTDIGTSGLHMRILRIGAGASRTDPTSTDYEISIAAFGAPMFPKNGGQWSFVLQTENSTPKNVDPQKGVPLIQQNAANSTSPILPYRFADPSDLIAGNPEFLYSLMHSTASYRLLFPQPKIEATAPHQISGTLALYLADPFALSTSIGLFPQTSACIVIDDNNWKLNIASDGNLQLQLSAASFTATPVGRVLHNNPNIRSIAYTNDDKGNSSVISLAIDTASTPSWSCNITNLSLAIETDTFGEISRIVGVIDSSSIQPAKFNDPRLVFGPKMAVAAALVSFLEYFGPTPPLDVGFGSVSAGLVFNLQKLLSMPAASVSPVGKWFEQYVIDLDFTIAFASTDDSVHYEISTELTFKIPLIPEGPSPIIVFLANTDFTMGDAGDTFTLTVGAGYGYQGKIADFQVYAYAAISLTFIAGNSLFGIGLSLLLRADIDFDIVEAEVTAEVRAEMLHISCGSGPTDKTVWAVGQFTLAVDITIFLVLDIQFHYQAECSKNTDNGSCPLVDV